MQQPRLKDLVTIKVIEWYDLGLQLDIDDHELDVIQKDHCGDVRACRWEMFRTWLKNFPTATYQQLVQALHNIGENREAYHICKRYGKLFVEAGVLYIVHPFPPKHCLGRRPQAGGVGSLLAWKCVWEVSFSVHTAISKFLLVAGARTMSSNQRAEGLEFCSLIAHKVAAVVTGSWKNMVFSHPNLSDSDLVVSVWSSLMSLLSLLLTFQVCI